MERDAREQLLRLRQLLAEAQERAHDASPVGRHVAVILLDGSCEAAMRLVCADIELEVKENTTFHDLRSKVAQSVTGWARDGWSDVAALHLARNAAQHRAITPDGSDVARWAGATERFIRGIVFAHFGVDINDILLAGAVEEPELQQTLEAAEQAAQNGEPFLSLQQTVEAFDYVRAKWQAQRASAVDPVTLYGSPLGMTAGDGANRAIAELVDYAEVTPFVQNLGEYIWFLARRDDLARGMPPTTDEARRALRFVVDWVLRWEAFTGSYAGRRYAPAKERPLPTTGAGEPPVIISSEVQRRDDPSIAGVPSRRYAIALEVANLPADDLSEFIGFFKAALADLPEGQLKRSGDPAHGSLGPDGVVRFWGVEPEISPAALIARVQAALEIADRALADLRDRRARWNATSEAILDAWRKQLQHVTLNGRPLFESFGIDGIVAADGTPKYAISAAAPQMGQDELGTMVWDVLNTAGISIGTDISYHGAEWHFTNALDAEAAANKAQEVAELLESRIAQEQAKQGAADAATAAVKHGLDEAIAAGRNVSGPI